MAYAPPRAMGISKYSSGYANRRLPVAKVSAGTGQSGVSVWRPDEASV